MKRVIKKNRKKSKIKNKKIIDNEKQTDYNFTKVNEGIFYYCDEARALRVLPGAPFLGFYHLLTGGKEND